MSIQGRRMAGHSLVLLVVFWLTLLPQAAAASPSVLVTDVQGAITPVVADHLKDSLRVAADDNHTALLVTIDTPGGLDTSMRDIIKGFLGARVPVIVYVSPSGGRAASAGALITFSAHVAAMAPGTTIGAATPVDLQGGEISDKIINDAAAFAETVARAQGRNAEFAIDTVRKGRAVTADEALRLKAIDLIAPDVTTLLQALDGRTVRLAGAEHTLRLAGAQLTRYEPSFARKLLQLLADPNLAFLFLSLGTLAIVYELANPGAGLGGIIGVILLLLGFFALSVLPVNVAGLALLGLALALFAAEIFTPGVGIFAGGGAIALVLSGLFLFEGSLGVSPAVLWPTAAVVGGGSLFAGRLAWRARRAQPTIGKEAFVDRETVVHSVSGEGATVFLEGAWWQARSQRGQLQPGQHVRVVALEDLTLVVEPVEPTGDPT